MVWLAGNKLTFAPPRPTIIIFRSTSLNAGKGTAQYLPSFQSRRLVLIAGNTNIKSFLDFTLTVTLEEVQSNIFEIPGR